MRPEPAAPSFPLPREDRGKFITAACNGTALYILTYYLVWGLHQVAKLGMSHHYHLRGNWDPSRIRYTLGDGEWWRTAIIAVHGIGPAVCLLVGAVAFRYFWYSERASRGQFKLLLMWLAMHCCNAVFGALLADTLTESGFWYVPDWLFQVGSAVNIVLALLAGLMQLALGYFGAIAFLQAHDSRTVMRFSHRQLMVTSTLVVPWVAGGVLIALAKIPYFSMHEGLHLLIMGLLVVPMALGCLTEIFSDTVRRPQNTRVAWGLVAAALVVALAWRLALSPPVAFG